jgi:hypothetical protein
LSTVGLVDEAIDVLLGIAAGPVEGNHEAEGKKENDEEHDGLVFQEFQILRQIAAHQSNHCVLVEGVQFVQPVDLFVFAPEPLLRTLVDALLLFIRDV